MAEYDEKLHCAWLLQDVMQERLHQIEKWGGARVDDEKNTPNDFVSYLAHYSTRWYSGAFPPYDTDTLRAFRKSMIQTAALALAAAQWVDRELRKEDEFSR